MRGPMDGKFEVLERQVGYQGFFHLNSYTLRHRLFSGEMSPVVRRELFERGHAVAVLLYDPNLDRVVLLEQFRIGALTDPLGPWLMEIVAGIIEPGEQPEGVAARETEEETGARLLELERICRYYVSPGGTSETISLYCGRIDATNVDGVWGKVEEGEDIRVCTVSFQDAFEMVDSGQINSAAPIIALQWLAMNRQWLREKWSG